MRTSVFGNQRVFFVALSILVSVDCFASESLSARGYGKTNAEAISDAKRTVISKVCGETIVGTSRATSEVEKSAQISMDGKKSKSLSTNSKTQDDNLSIVGGSIRTFKVTGSGSKDSAIFVDIDAQGVTCQSSETTQAALTNSMLVKELGKVRSELGKIGESSGLVKNPKNVAQKYHNARVLSQRGEVDLALKAYESLLSEKVIFADPIEDMVALSKRIYGGVSARSYVERTFAKLKNRPEYLYAMQLLSREPLEVVASNLETIADTFPPLAFLYFDITWNYVLTGKIPMMEHNDYVGKLVNNNIDLWRDLSNRLNDGQIANFYIDTNRANKWSESPLQGIEVLSQQYEKSESPGASDLKLDGTGDANVAYQSCVLDLNSKGVDKSEIKSICTCILLKKQNCPGSDLYRSKTQDANTIVATDPSKNAPAKLVVPTGVSENAPAKPEMNDAEKTVLDGLDAINKGLDGLLSILPGTRRFSEPKSNH
jgi:hypothetical protein